MGLFIRGERPAPITASADGSRRAKAASYGSPRAISASAGPISPEQMQAAKTIPYRSWQADAWTGYDRIGEIHYGFNLVANIFSRVRIHGAVIKNLGEAPTPIGVALSNERKDDDISPRLARAVKELMDELVGTDWSSQVRTYALAMSIPGECLLVEIPGDENGSPSQWTIRSTDEIRVEADTIKLVPRAGIQPGSPDVRVLDRKAKGEWVKGLRIGRIWRRHPHFTDEPDSSLKAITDNISELLLISHMIRNAARARLNAGALFVPDGVVTAGATVAPADVVVDSEGNPITEQAVQDENALLDDLMDSITQPIGDEAAATSVIPLIWTGPAELGEKIRHMTFERTSDEWLITRADRELERILQGIDVPKEVVTGLANVKYSNAIQIDDDLYKANIEPLALMFVDALTDIYLRPRLVDRGFTWAEAMRVCVWYDPSEIVTRPNQSEDANWGYEKHLLSADAWRREHGFGDDDKPSETEQAIQLLFAKGNLPEDVTNALLEVAFPTLMGAKREENIEDRPVAFPESAQQMLGGQEQ